MRKTSVFNFFSGLAISLKKEQELMFKDLDIKLIIYMIHEERCSLRVGPLHFSEKFLKKHTVT